MTKEQFIKELEHIAESGSNEIRLGNLFDLVIAQDRESRWISVKERLPELNESILMFGRRSYSNANRVVCSGVYTRDWYSVGEFVFDVTHWQPLPEAPKQLTP